MREPLVILTDAPDAAATAAIDDGLADFNAAQAGYRDWRPLAVLVQDPEDGRTIGGLLGRTSLGLFFLDLLYLPDELRSRRLGSTLMRIAEEEAVQRGCGAAFVLTISFQAPGFYRRHGYEEFGRIDCEPPGTSRVFLRKRLERGRLA